MTAPTERFHVLAQLEHLHLKFVGTLNSDSTKWECMTSQHRDTLASIIGHQDHLTFVSIAQNKTKARVRFELMQKMIQPCGPPPERSALDDF
uniref:Splicing factor 3B subunit 5 n=1 Tax=Rhabditophanes sp. KR3021 TaxID=114890 RepID=A0AC35TIV6_9BILA